MKQKLLAIACISLFAVAACKKSEPAEAAAAPEVAPVEQPAAPAVIEPEPASAGAMSLVIKGFAGRFSGVLPCADCPGIETRLTLNADGTSTLQQTYRNRSETVAPIAGTWTVEAENKHIRLDPDAKAENDRLYEILSNDEIRPLDPEGKHIESDLPYNLKREATTN